MTHDLQILTLQNVGLYPQMLDLFGRAFDDPERYVSNLPDDAYIASLLARDEFVALVAVEDSVVIGALAGYELKKFEQPCSEFYIYDIAVDEVHRRKGVATDLIHKFGEIAAGKNGSVVFVQADYGDEPAIALYTKLGRREDVMHFDIEVG